MVDPGPTKLCIPDLALPAPRGVYKEGPSLWPEQEGDGATLWPKMPVSLQELLCGDGRVAMGMLRSQLKMLPLRKGSNGGVLFLYTEPERGSWANFSAVSFQPLRFQLP